MPLKFLAGFGGAISALAGFGMGLSPGFGGAVDNVLAAHYMAAQRRKFSQRPSKQLPPEQLTDAYFRGLLSEDQYYGWMAENGFNRARAFVTLKNARQGLTVDQIVSAYYMNVIDKEETFRLTARQGMTAENTRRLIAQNQMPLSPTNILDAFWRGEIDYDQYLLRMKENHYTKEDADLFQKANFFFPPVSDLIRFQVREVFREDVVRHFGYDSDFPEEIVPLGAKLGMNRETLKWYWRAHWDIPSPTQLYEMMHRLHPEVLEHTAHTFDFPAEFMQRCVTTKEEVEQGLKAANIPPFWRDRFLALSFKSLTRVDLRRVYLLGLVDDNYVIATLREGGYSKFDAELLLKYFKRAKVREFQRITAAQLRSLFSYGDINEDEFERELRELKFDDDDIKFAKLIEKRRIRDRTIKELVITLEKEFIEGVITEDRIRARLGGKGMNEVKINQIMLRLKRARRRNIRHPPIRTLQGWLKKKLINEDKFSDFLQKQGFSDEYIEVFIRESMLND